MIRYIIIDDEPIAHRIIEGYGNNLPHLEKVGNCYDAFEAMQMLNQEQIDLIFLDINMPKLSGFEFLKTLSNPPKIIVTTAYKEFAIEGYELDITDYLLKPFPFERFVKAINKTINTAVKNNTTTAQLSPVVKQTRFFIKGDKKYHQIATETILFIEAYGNYTKLYLNEGMIVSHEKISSLEEVLSKDNFIRVHKSFIVAIDKIETIEGNRILIDTHKIPIGQTYKSSIYKLYSSNG
ncbi:LytTR family DNA-binding domain-containing protein [Aquimarina sp. Aq78]|uniref:LytR/AlgR family response regulator transcription factor n=1 Tax=Aquimarina sp. Aq78 TaxID=1191889 RepID=UPI000D10572A|nr:LytTR family DNA-binding domain-containing protein [Aquimarina sp. Aq78]